MTWALFFELGKYRPVATAKCGWVACLGAGFPGWVKTKEDLGDRKAENLAD